jgi:hypothetical protein
LFSSLFFSSLSLSLFQCEYILTSHDHNVPATRVVQHILARGLLENMVEVHYMQAAPQYHTAPVPQPHRASRRARFSGWEPWGFLQAPGCTARILTITIIRTTITIRIRIHKNNKMRLSRWFVSVKNMPNADAMTRLQTPLISMPYWRPTPQTIVW